MADQLEDGVYIGLPADDYFAQDTMGSTDWVKLEQVKLGWWWQSRHNKRRKPEKDTGARNYGSALHAILLEGEEAYEGRWIVKPEKLDYPGVVDTREEMRDVLSRDANVVRPESTPKAKLALDMGMNLPHIPCWYTIEEDFKARAGERPVISAEEDWALRFMRHMALDPERSDNQAIRRLLEPQPDHPPLAEVSVFATLDGIRRRWRFDRLFLGATMDLKSLAGWRGRALNFEAGDIAARNGWLIQRADYEIGREELRRLVHEGGLHGGDLDQRRYIQQIADQPDWFWLWIAYQKPDFSGTAPILMPIQDRRGSDRHNDGWVKLQRAIRFYRAAVAEFGLDQAWGRVEPLHYTEPRTVNGINLPEVYFPHWVAEKEEQPE